jgi:predicted nucleic-acid-binding protein
VIGIDSGVLLRLFDRGEPSLSTVAEQLIARAGREGTCFVHPLVLAEFAGILGRDFKLSRGAVSQYLERILSAPEFTIPSLNEALKAIERFRAEEGSFLDCFLVELNLAAGCDTTATFKVCAAESAGFSLLTG